MRARNIHATAGVVRHMADRLRRSLHRREARAFAVSWSAAVLTGCSVPGPMAPSAAVKVLERTEYSLADGTPGSYLRAGDPDGPRLIYVHGSPGDAKAFADDLVEPVPGFESVSMDRPGFGTLRHTGPVTSFEMQARAIEPLLVQRDGQWPILIGHSLGGPIIARAAADFPDRVGGLVIVAGSLDPALEELRWFNHIAAAPPVRWILPGTIKTSNAEMFAAFDETTELAGVLGRVRCPVAIVHGTQDGLVPVANVDYTRRMLTNAAAIRVDVLDDQGHFLVWNKAGRAAIRQAIDWARTASTADRHRIQE
ncbi:MAG: alpha/beta fold hydrolase [Planctomycetota bacterium]